jgi:hypothetical protein
VVPDQRMDEEVEDLLITIADDFIEKLIALLRKILKKE